MPAKLAKHGIARVIEQYDDMAIVLTHSFLIKFVVRSIKSPLLILGKMITASQSPGTIDRKITSGACTQAVETANTPHEGSANRKPPWYKPCSRCLINDSKPAETVIIQPIKKFTAVLLVIKRIDHLGLTKYGMTDLSNRDTKNARLRERYANDPVYRAHMQAYQREYRRKRYADDPVFRETVLATSKRYRASPELYAATRARKRVMQRAKYASDPEYRARHLAKTRLSNRQRYANSKQYREDQRRRCAEWRAARRRERIRERQP